MFYKFINENTIEKAPKPLRIGNKTIFTNSEKIYNEQGYYKVVSAEYPQDDKIYKPTYTLENYKGLDRNRRYSHISTTSS